MAGNVNMYKVKPLYHIGTVDIPNVMYKMDPLIKPIGNLHENDDKAPSTQSLEQRQIALLEQLDSLISEVNGGSSQKVTTTGRSAFAKELLSASQPLDIVIHADPQNPPHSLAYILKTLQANYRTLFRVHVLSCAPQNNDLFPTSTSHESRSPFELVLTLIWSSSGLLPRLCVNPATSSSIHGESNIARFFGRFLGCYDCGAAATHDDIIMDMCCDHCDTINNCTNGKKEKMTACKEVLKILPKIENKQLAKAMLSSTLKNFKDLPQGDLKKWVQSN